MSACASGEDLRNLHLDVRNSAARQDSLVQAILEMSRVSDDATRDSLRVLAEQMFAFRGDTNSRLREIQDQLSRITESSGQLERNVTDLRADMTNQQRQMNQIAQQAASQQPEGSATEADSEEEDPPPAQSEEADEIELNYNVSVQHWERGSFQSARHGFERIVEDYPDHPRAPSSYLYLAEIISLDSENHEEAVETYLRVPELYPEAKEVPNALYQAGLLLKTMGAFVQAREVLERIIVSYPDHALGAKAQEQLQEIP